MARKDSNLPAVDCSVFILSKRKKIPEMKESFRINKVSCVDNKTPYDAELMRQVCLNISFLNAKRCKPRIVYYR